jgi:hypothetical protein
MLQDVLDNINTIRGKESCAWCVTQPESLIEKFDTWMLSYIERWPSLRSWYVRNLMDWGWRLGIWKFGRWWHHRYHLTDEDRAYLDECPCFNHCAVPDCTLTHEWGKGPRTTMVLDPPYDGPVRDIK